MTADIVIRIEVPEDRDAVWELNRAAFESDAEAQLVDSLRDDGFIEVSLVAERQGEVVGHIVFSRVTIASADRTVDAMSLAPMAVRSDYQRQGIGSQLVTAGMDACRERGHGIAVVLGHPNFYSRFGFSSQRAVPLQNPFGAGDAWMACELQPGALDGVAGQVRYPPPFGVFE